MIGLPHNVVLADALSRDAILTGMRDGTSWIAESAAVDVRSTATSDGRSAGIGERLDVEPDALITITAEVTGIPYGVIRLITDEGQMQQVSLPASGAGSASWRTTAQVAAYSDWRCGIRSPTARRETAREWDRSCSSGRWRHSRTRSSWATRDDRATGDDEEHCAVCGWLIRRWQNRAPPVARRNTLAS